MSAQIITEEEARRAAAVQVARLVPLTEAEAWAAAQDDPWTLLSSGQRWALETLETLDFLMTGQSRGCHYGRCRTDPQGNPLPIDTSWRGPSSVSDATAPTS